LLLGGRAVGLELLQGNGGDSLGQGLQVSSHPTEGGGALESPLVHVDRAVELELDRVEAGSWIAVVLGDESPGIGLVAAHRIAQRAQGLLRALHHRGGAAGAVTVSDDDIRAWTLVLGAGRRRHGVAIDQHRGPELPVQTGKQAAQRPVIGLVEALDAPNGVVHGNALAIDLLRIAYDAGESAQSARNAHRAGIRKGREAAVEHARVKLIGLAIDVHVAAGEMGTQQGKAPPHHAERELVYEAVLRAAQCRNVEPGGGEERARIDTAAMGGVEQDRSAPLHRFEHFERWVELVFQFEHDRHEGGLTRRGETAGTGLPIATGTALSMARVPPVGSLHIYPPCALCNGERLREVKLTVATGWKMPKIILAEDDGDMRRFLVRALQNAGYEVISFDNGLSAYQRLREEPFELLLTDIVMPEMDGIELARRASELDPDIKIMFITGFAAVALNADSNAPKNAKVLSKPVHLRELVNEVQKMLAA
jgi:two-component system, cell cycle response regulator CpdR